MSNLREDLINNGPMTLLLALVIQVLYVWFRKRRSLSFPPPPLAQPCLPFLGNALHYKDKPDQFLSEQHKILGDVFTINLAGLKTTILSSRKCMKQFALTSENVLSSKAAVADFGFRYTLGDENVFFGTDVHKFIVKTQYGSVSSLEDTARSYFKYLNISMSKEFGATISTNTLNQSNNNDIYVDDFMTSTRRIILRTIAYEMLGVSVVDMYDKIHRRHIVQSRNNSSGHRHSNRGGDRSSKSKDQSSACFENDFVSDFMTFQDFVEECTAKAAVCPEWLASIWFLKECESKRLALVLKISTVLKKIIKESQVPSESVLDDESENTTDDGEADDIVFENEFNQIRHSNSKLNSYRFGKWLKNILKMKRLVKTEHESGTFTSDFDTDFYSIDEISNFIIGLLFAAHKNPAIAAAQNVLHMLEYESGPHHHNDDDGIKRDDNGSLLSRIQQEVSICKQRFKTEKSLSLSLGLGIYGDGDGEGEEDEEDESDDDDDDDDDENVNEKHRKKSFKSSDRKDVSSVLSILQMNCPLLNKVTLETLRVTAHSIGAVRKVVSEEGWEVEVSTTEGRDEPEEESKDDSDQHLSVHETDDKARKQHSGDVCGMSKGTVKYLLPYGSYVGVSHIVPHRDILRWGEDCDQFNPFRDNIEEKCKDPFLFTTFSHGVHACPGSKLAILLVKLYTVVLLSRYEDVSITRHSIDKKPNAILPETSFERATLAQRSGPCKLTLKNEELLT